MLASSALILRQAYRFKLEVLYLRSSSSRAQVPALETNPAARHRVGEAKRESVHVQQRVVLPAPPSEYSDANW